jgi:hypothetical protein
MTRVNALVALVMLLAQGTPAPNLSGEWKLASSTRNAGRGEEPQKRYVADGWAFNCGRECRIVQKGTTLTIENAQLADADASSPTVTIELDGKPHTVVDSGNRGSNLEVSGRWENGTLTITTMLAGRPTSQTISLDHSQLVVVTSLMTSKLTYRYSKK